jgi:hypothetical protein
MSLLEELMKEPKPEHGACPGCSAPRAKQKPHKVVAGVFECTRCKAVHGRCYLGDSYGIVRPWFSSRTDLKDAVYFDFETVGSEGLDRRHGWYDPATRLVLQIG